MAAVRLPRISNSTDVEALACEPGVLVRWVADVADLADADVVVLPGSKATVSDLAWLRERGLADAVTAHAGVRTRRARHLRWLPDALPHHRRSGRIRRLRRVDGLGLLDADIVFEPDKTLRHWTSRCAATRFTTARSRAPRRDPWLDVGIRRGAVYGTHWHGLLDNDDVRRRWLTDAATAAGRHGFVVADDVDVTARRDAQLDLMADLLAAHLDVDAVMDCWTTGLRRRRPTVIIEAANLET